MSNPIRISAGNAALATTALPQSSISGPSQGEPNVQVSSAKPKAESKPATSFDPQKLLSQMQEIVDRINEQMKDHNRNLGFSIDRKINTFVVTVRNSNTGEVVRQIPSEVVVKVAHSLEEMRGLLFNEKL